MDLLEAHYTDQPCALELVGESNHARVYQYLGKEGVMLGAEVTSFVNKGQVGVQRVVCVTRLTNEFVFLFPVFFVQFQRHHVM